MSLFGLLHLSVSIPQLSFLFFELFFRDLPERVHFIAFQLEVIAFFALSVQFLTKTTYVLFKLVRGRKSHQNILQHRLIYNLDLASSTAISMGFSLRMGAVRKNLLSDHLISQPRPRVFPGNEVADSHEITEKRYTEQASK
jgi:hypothetical protein